MKNIIARQYGSIVIERGICSECGDPCIVCKDNTSSCCNAEVNRFASGIIVKETQGALKRKRPSRYLQKELLEEQNNRCFWCGREFGSYVLSPKNNLRVLTPVWDHYLPYSYTGDNKGFVASCDRCNRHKSAILITATLTEDLLREHLKKSGIKADGKIYNRRFICLNGLFLKQQIPSLSA